jgi:CxC5 like cysteine cluster associated with KDZ transposases
VFSRHGPFTSTAQVSSAIVHRLFRLTSLQTVGQTTAVQRGVRHYYDRIPDFIQVGEHQFIERKLADLWIGLMVLGWYIYSQQIVRQCPLLTTYLRFSATDAARVYSMTLADKQNMEDAGWQFGSKLTTDHVWDTFLIVSLLEDRIKTGYRLEVPHDGAQCDRFNIAMDERNERLILNGQDEVAHCCNKCMRVFKMDDGTYRMPVICHDVLS